MLILERSFFGKRWNIKTSGAKSLLEHLQFIRPQEDFDKFFKKSINDFWPKIDDLDDLQKGINLISNAIKNNIKIGIVGDYDVDGSSATGILVAYFKKINANFTFHIPNRFSEGYGISNTVVDKLLDQDVEIIITVDNGTSAYEAIDYIHSKNKKIVILDHHHIQKPIEVAAFINPHRRTNGLEILCATGVVFIFLVELNKYLVANEIISINFNVFNFIDVVAVATICDVMPLMGLNRVLVAHGINKLNIKPIPGYGAILRNYIGKIDSQTVGFILGPCINAPGRMNSANKAVELVYEEDEVAAKILASDLISLNIERRAIDKETLEKAEKQINELKLNKNFSITVFGEWFEGVIGIVAGRLKDKYNKPTCVLAKNGDFWKGSLRSISGFHVGNMVKKAIDVGIVTLGGGHEMAGGVSIENDKLNDFIKFFESEVENSNVTPCFDLDIDAMISLSAVPIIQEISEEFAPFGNSNPDFLLMFPNCVILHNRNFEKSSLISISSSSLQNPVECWIFNPSESIVNSLKKGTNAHIVAQIMKGKDKLELKLIDFIINQI